MKVLSAEYANTGGNCFCMFAHVADCEELGKDGKDVWLIGSVDCYDVPIIDFYRSERGAYDSYGESDEDYITWSNTERHPWTVELWKEMFRYCIDVNDTPYNYRNMAIRHYKFYVEEL